MYGTNNIALGTNAMLGGDTGTPSNNTGNNNISIGSNALFAIISGYGNVALGNLAGASTTTGSSNFFAGAGAGRYNTTGAGNIGIGSNSLRDMNGTNNLSIGYNLVGGNADPALNTGSKNIGIGNACGNKIETGYSNIIMGDQVVPALKGGQYNILMGRDADNSIVDGNHNIIIGNFSFGSADRTGEVAIGSAAGSACAEDYCVFLGYGAGHYETGANKLFIDNNVRSNEADGRIKAMIYGEFASATANQNLFLNANVTINSGFADCDFIIRKLTSGEAFKYDSGLDEIQGDFILMDSAYNTLLGKNTGGRSITTGLYNFVSGTHAGLSLTAGKHNMLVGWFAGSSITTASNIIAIGNAAARYADVSSVIAIGAGACSNVGGASIGIGSSAVSRMAAAGNIGIGSSAVQGTATQANNTGQLNIGIGTNAMRIMQAGWYNIVIGHNAGYVLNDGGNNTFIGLNASQTITDGDYNTFLGANAGRYGTDRAYNTAIGAGAGYNCEGDNSVFLGANAGYYETGANKLFIDNWDRTDEAGGRIKAMIYGEFNANVLLQNLSLNANVTLNSDVDKAKLSRQPTGTDDLAIATTKYVDDNGGGGAATEGLELLEATMYGGLV